MEDRSRRHRELTCTREVSGWWAIISLIFPVRRVLHPGTLRLCTCLSWHLVWGSRMIRSRRYSTNSFSSSIPPWLVRQPSCLRQHLLQTALLFSVYSHDVAACLTLISDGWSHGGRWPAQMDEEEGRAVITHDIKPQSLSWWQVSSRPSWLNFRCHWFSL